MICQLTNYFDQIPLSLHPFYPLGRSLIVATAGLGSKYETLDRRPGLKWSQSTHQMPRGNVPRMNQVAIKCRVHTSGLMRIVKRILMAKWFFSFLRWFMNSCRLRIILPRSFAISVRLASSNWSCISVQLSKLVCRTWSWRSMRSKGSSSWYKGRRAGCSAIVGGTLSRKHKEDLSWTYMINHCESCQSLLSWS